MSKVFEIENCLEAYIPSTLAASWDNVGLLVGDRMAEVTKILIAVDITDSVISEAVEKGCNMIISHHPVIFDPLKSVLADSLTSGRVFKLVSLGIAAICIHTPLDIVAGGMNDKLCEKCAITDTKNIILDDVAVGKMGFSQAPMDVTEFAQSVKTAIGAPSVTFYDSHKHVNNVAVVSGSGAFILNEAKRLGCDTVLTGEAKHNQFVDAKDLEINLVCAGHYHTELWGLDLVADRLTQDFPNIRLIRACSTNDLYQTV